MTLRSSRTTTSITACNVPTVVSLGLNCDSQPTKPLAGSALLDELADASVPLRLQPFCKRWTAD